METPNRAINLRDVWERLSRPREIQPPFLLHGCVVLEIFVLMREGEPHHFLIVVSLVTQIWVIWLPDPFNLGNKSVGYSVAASSDGGTRQCKAWLIEKKMIPDCELQCRNDSFNFIFHQLCPRADRQSLTSRLSFTAKF